MTCKQTKIGDVVIWSCSRGRDRAQTCRCGSGRATGQACSFALSGRKAGQVCGAELCDSRSVSVGDLPYCAAHGRRMREVDA